MKRSHQMIFQPNSLPFNQCHASTLIKTQHGDVFVAWFGGDKEAAPNTAIWLSRKSTLTSTWSIPHPIQGQVDNTPCWNPVLHHENGIIYLFWKQGKTCQSWLTFFSYSTDNGNTWSQAKELVHGDPLPRGPVKNKLIKISDGSLLAGSSVESGKSWYCFIDRSFDNGKTWVKSNNIYIDRGYKKQHDGNAFSWKGLQQDLSLWTNDLNVMQSWEGVIQPSLWQDQHGNLHALMRSTEGYIYRSDCLDGKNWSMAYPTILVNNNSGLDLVQVDNVLYLACNPIQGNWAERSPLSILYSLDQGITWEKLTDLETEPGEYSYPALISANNTLLCSYTWNRRSVSYVEIPLKRQQRK